MKKPKPLDWRAVLTPAERQLLDRIDAAKAAWQRLNLARAGIVNRAIQRAKFGYGARR